MNAAFSIWEERIAPVFDVASQVAIVDEESGDTEPDRISLTCHVPETVISTLLGRRVSILICGAISRPLHDTFVLRGIAVHPFVAGELATVIRAWREKRLKEDCFRMPGCGYAADRAHAGGHGQRFRRRGGSGLPYGASVIPTENAMCRCPMCGYALVHEPGVPCSRQRCPNCHAPMVRA
ncbi:MULTISPECIES: hypothetical protein [unclassified Pseudodesulfovibrio]|uniref:NifB/NifX family molybdenum-iron cluster-binding protein n=1 Tax=unclassified Pseudodesulfovibrio TaxID=2661612 RepID=UPI000FEBD134|nr:MULTISPECIES: hypothetical protein [unclassified Pseudodesulfovibrio]MCJ2165488.1 hypothetical protein [Pseudodesulfovibrio sp. S3-i]RWU03237.1 hypothetical protein DWB63_12665 [Pseudodesulfovibrio sp. S3]